ncbi:MAG: hypothetical protein ACYS8Z_24825 [Planctomycetota bacterium]
MDCPECGQRISEGEVLCSSCGWALSWESAPHEGKAFEREMRRGRIAAVASIVCFFLPIGLVSAWFLLCWYASTQPMGCEGVGIGIMIIMGIVYGICLGGVMSVIGTVLATYAALASNWRRGKLGLVLNIILLLAASLLFFTLTSKML